MDKLSGVSNGLLKNFFRRSFIAQDDPWWSESNSEWKLTIEHSFAPNGTIGPDFWLDEVLDLCEHEVLHQYFGLGFSDLMHMDPATFDKIRTRVYDLERKIQERQDAIAPPNLKKELKG